MNSNSPKWPRGIARVASCLVTLTGALALLGWALDFGVFKSVGPGFLPMVPNTALAFGFAGLSLWLLCAEPVDKSRKRAARIAGFIVMLIGALSLIEYLAGSQLGIDQLLFREKIIALGTPLAGRPAFLAALSFVFVGAALLLRDGKRVPVWVVELLIAIPIEISLLALIGYACNVPSFYRWNSLFSNTAMALNTAIAFVILGVGFLCARPDHGLMKIITGATTGSVVARRLLLAPVIIPLLTGLCGNAGRRAGIYNIAFAGWLFSFLNIFVFTLVIWWLANLLHRADAVRLTAEIEVRQLNDDLEKRVTERTDELKQAEQSLHEREERLQLIIDTALDAVITINQAGIVTSWSRRAEAMFGWSAFEILGERLSETIIPPRYRAAHEQGLKHFAETGHGPVLNRRIEITAQRRDGKEIPIELAITPVQIDGEYMFSAFVRDITETKRARAELERQSAELQLIFDTVPAIIFYKDTQHRLLRINQASARCFGRTKEEIEGRTDEEIGSPHSQRYYEDEDEIISTGQPKLGIIEPIETAAGTRWLQTDKFPHFDEKGGINGVIGFAMDITERQRAEEELRSSEARFSTVFRSGPVAMSINIVADGRLIDANEQYCKFFGYARDEIIGRSALDLNLWANPEERAPVMHRLLEEGAVRGFEVKQRRRSGEVRDVLASLELIELADESEPVLISMFTDITERKRAEETRAQLAAIVESSEDAIISKTLDGVITSWNRGAEKLFGYAAEEAIGRPMLMLFAPERVGEESETLARIRQGQSVEHFETVRVTKSGKRIDVSVALSPIRNAHGQIVGASKIARDVTERKVAEEKLQAQLARVALLNQITRAIGERQDLQSIFQVAIQSLEDNLPIDFGCVCLYDAAEEVLTVASVGTRSADVNEQLALADGTRIAIDQNGLARCVRGELVYEPDVSQVNFAFPARLASGGLRSLIAAPVLVESQVFGVFIAARRETHAFSSPDCEFVRQLSEHVALAAHQTQIHSALQQAYTELRQTQQSILQQERLRALGQMASGIAHDINNAISPITLYTESLLEREPDLSPRARHQLTTIQNAVEDVAKTVARLKEFYRQREPQLALVPIDFNGLIRRVLDLTRARWRDMPQERGVNIRLETELAADLPTTMGADAEIRDALTNLIINAVDAMPEGGVLTLRTRAASSGADDDTVVRVFVEISDTGIGMDEGTRRRCLEPFFTTKGERGTGLGLAMVYGMVERHSADIEIESEVGKGTTVRLIFPVAKAVETASIGPITSVRPSQRLRILVVDDDPLLTKSLQDTLEDDGHLVIVADGGQAGIDAFHAAQSAHKPFAVVLTDLGMPNVDGRKVASAIKAVSASTPVIMLTGWGQRMQTEGDVPPQVDRVLSKPPKLHELRAALAACCPAVST